MTSIEVSLLDGKDNTLLSNISSITDLSNIDPAEYPLLKVKYELIRRNTETKSPVVRGTSWTWEGNPKATEMVYSGIAWGEDLVLENLDFRKYGLVKIYGWMVIDNYSAKEGYLKLNGNKVISREAGTPSNGYHFDISIYEETIERGLKIYPRAGDSKAAVYEAGMASAFKTLLNTSVIDIPIKNGPNNTIEIFSGKNGTGNYIMKIIGYR